MSPTEALTSPPLATSTERSVVHRDCWSDFLDRDNDWQLPASIGGPGSEIGCTCQGFSDAFGAKPWAWRQAECDKSCLNINRNFSSAVRLREWWVAHACATAPSDTNRSDWECPCYDTTPVRVDDGRFVAYIKWTWNNLHAETHYSYAHYICGGSVRVSPPWPRLPNNSTDSRPPVIFLGPESQISPEQQRIWMALNESSPCPLLFGEPESPDLTVLATWAPNNATHKRSEQNTAMINNSSFILICHWPRLCGHDIATSTNVYGLTPKHPKYILPSYFPLPFTSLRSEQPNRQADVPVFLVLGGVIGTAEKSKPKRNWDSLVGIFQAHSHRRFVVRVAVWGPLPSILAPFKSHVQLVSKLSDDQLMTNISDVYAILPLVDDKNFGFYEGGRKLTSTVMWGMGFNMSFVIWDRLADLYSVPTETAFTYSKSDGLPDAFGRALDRFEQLQASSSTNVATSDHLHSSLTQSSAIAVGIVAATTEQLAPTGPFNNTFIITLGRDTARVVHVRNQTENVFPGASIFWAYDGQNLTQAQITQWQVEGYLNATFEELSIMNPSKPIGRAKIACFMSHIRLWERLTAEPADDAFYMVMEDDVLPSEDFHTRYPLVLAELADQPWDWVHLHIHPRFASSNRAAIPGKQLINRAIKQWASHGYLISKRGARKLLKLMLPVSAPKDTSFDLLLSMDFIEAYMLKEALVASIGQLTSEFHKDIATNPDLVFRSNIHNQ